jgi:hypothetical protein
MVLCVCIVVCVLAAQPAADDHSGLSAFWGCFVGVKDNVAFPPCDLETGGRERLRLRTARRRNGTCWHNHGMTGDVTVCELPGCLTRRTGVSRQPWQVSTLIQGEDFPRKMVIVCSKNGAQRADILLHFLRKGGYDAVSFPLADGSPTLANIGRAVQFARRVGCGAVVGFGGGGILDAAKAWLVAHADCCATRFCSGGPSCVTAAR